MNILRLFKKSVKVGDKAPDFTLVDQSGNAVRLKDHIGKEIVVLYFYPKDDTYGCIAESSAFRDQYDLFKQAGADIIGISSDSPESHLQFAATYKLPFILLSDPRNKVRTRYGVPATMGLIPGRVTYVIDKSGIVRFILNSQFNPISHVEGSLKTVRELR
ncbi:MAG: peroxiredoxin [Elusimicrobia bacterium]|nr:peroxiredoxin [Candidatus Obscuribacterium magneticum]